MAKISLLILVLVLSVVDVALALSASNVKAMYHYYGADENNWDLKAANAYCSSADGSQSLAWRKKFGWTAFCGPSGPTGHAACGKCLKVTNAKTGKQVTVRIIDTCTMGGLKLDATVFRFLDNGKEGYYRGYLMVNYEFVSCLGS